METRNGLSKQMNPKFQCPMVTLEVSRAQFTSWYFFIRLQADFLKALLSHIIHDMIKLIKLLKNNIFFVYYFLHIFKKKKKITFI